MKAIVIREPGGAEVLEYRDVPVPTPGDRQVLIEVCGAGVNRPDIAQRKGHYPAPHGAPASIPGLEVSGRIATCGTNVTRWTTDQMVCALVAGGGYADYVLAHEDHCLQIPTGWSIRDAATLPETVFTVWHNVFERGQLQAGETLLVHGGMSGIGVTAIQMARAAGAQVMVTCGSDEKCDAAMRLGALAAFNYRTVEFEKSALEFTYGKGVDVILDMIGGPYLSRNISMMATDGRLALINFMGGDESMVRLSAILRKRLTITGSTLRNRTEEFKSRLAKEVFTNVWPWIEAGKIKPVIDSVFDLSEAPAAHHRMESGMHAGKIVLVTEAGKASA